MLLTTLITRPLAVALLLAARPASMAQDAPAPKVELPAPARGGGMPLMQALEGRRSTRGFADRALPAEVLSNLLWAADGVNRPATGGRTAPSSYAKYPVDVYVVLPRGLYRYDPPGHRLVAVAGGDHRAEAGTEPHERVAPLNLVYVADLGRVGETPAPASREDWLSWSAIEAGCIAQNVNLYCASEGLGAVVRVSVPQGEFRKAAGLRADQVILLGQSVGHPASR
ncbi:Nitroreductase family protein [Aquisphaera giovannonii]|uniref:Nitroreductase family protein n=1 Tax=Aquisphaera giovannonii TaxID=406548 RepID=A0A5B9WGX1_9BACT|nr:SagB/ThcOx family dehydrogenase [Aquisphaera giovannonii]QEH39090.1 Nitroreductase family protein [Aquisphaera giovannonii]